MKLPVCSDEQVEAVLRSAVPPVFVEWVEAGSDSVRGNKARSEIVMEEFDDKAIFIRCIIDENPNYAAGHAMMGPGFTLHVRNRRIWFCYGAPDLTVLREAVQMAVERAPTPPPPPCPGV